jgi:hypothetical protein
MRTNQVTHPVEIYVVEQGLFSDKTRARDHPNATCRSVEQSRYFPGCSSRAPPCHPAGTHQKRVFRAVYKGIVILQ